MTTPSPSGSKKQQQQQQEDVVPTDQLDDVFLRHAPASSPSPPDRLLLAPLDCRRLEVKAGDWVVVFSSPSSPSSPSSGNECQTPPRRRKRPRVVVLRAWPGSSGPSGAAGAGPFILGQFPHVQEAGRECFVSIRALSGSVRQVAASEVALRVVPPAEKEGEEGDSGRKATRPTVSCDGAAAAVLWKARLKDVLVGHLIYPGLRLTFASFAARATFEVVKVRAVEEEETSSCQGNEEDESVALPELAALSLAEKDSNNEGHDGTALRLHLLYQVGRHTRLRVVDPSSGEEFKEGTGGEEKLKDVETKQDAQEDEEDCWATVGGLQAAVQEVREGIEQALDSPEVFAQHGLRPTRGLLLVGASGTGKTTLLR